MGKLKRITSIAATIIGSAIVYESSLVGSRALLSDMDYIKKGPEPVIQKKHWWSRKKVVMSNEKI